MAWKLGKIWIYPIKSLPGLSVTQSVILPLGNLQHDREFALFDADGRFVNGKRTADFHRIRAEWNLDAWSVTLSVADETARIRFHLDHDREPLARWFSRLFGMPIRVEQRKVGGFPDDDDASGPTVVSTATLRAVAKWFPGLTETEIRSRFRANLEFDGGEAFSEDSLFARAGEPVEFRIGEAILVGTNPCQRCVVPTRSAETGAVFPHFQKIFAEHRKAMLSPETEASRFDHFYRLAVNTRAIGGKNQMIRVGDEVIK